MVPDEIASLRDDVARLKTRLRLEQQRARASEREARLLQEHLAIFETLANALRTGSPGLQADGPVPGVAPEQLDDRRPDMSTEAADALERARAAVRESAERQASAERSRDLYAMYLRSVASTGPGRLARRWVRFCEEHPRAARLIHVPMTGAWMVLTLRWPWWLRQHPLFDREWYLEVNRDVRGTRMRPWWHYVRHGIREGRAPNRYFDREWYLRTYPDVRMSGMEPLDHYFRFGGWEGRDPSPRFKTEWYLSEHPDVAAAGVNALYHFLRHGIEEGYQPRPMSGAAASAAARRTVGSNGASRSVRSVPARVAVPDASYPIPSIAPSPPHQVPHGSGDVGRVKRAIRSALPQGARAGVVLDGDRELLTIPGREIVPVPRADDGRPATDVPRNDLSAIAHVESLRVTHIDHLVVPEPSLWMTIVPGLQRHLEARYATVGRRGEGATIYDVRAPASIRDGVAQDAGEDARTLLRRVRERLGHEPSVLDWDSGAGIGDDLPGISLFTPPADGARRSLPYADASVDVVLVSSGDGERLAEARRVASTLVVATQAATRNGASAAPVSVDWIGEDHATMSPASVSIVIPTYDDVRLLAACLRTIDETVEGREVEVIVSDDGSDAAFHDPLDTLVARHERVRLLRSERNSGYIAAVNAGAASATGDVLVFLNNDTVLLPGWLEPLLDTLRHRPRTGVVGGMLLYPDGRLQEAGCAVFRDGSATKIGFGDSDPTLPYYAHPRSVDYVSGALLATPRDLFERLGGLDPAFGFGYYEDGDYCFRVRREGLDVVYQPRSVIVHVEGGTAGTDLTKGAKRFQATNQALFVERWRAELERQPVRPEPLDIHASRDLVVRGRTSPAAT